MYSYNSEKIEQLLTDIIELIVAEWGKNPFDTLEESLKRVQNRDFCHYDTIPNQFRSVAYTLWDGRVSNPEIYSKMDEITELINEGKD